MRLSVLPVEKIAIQGRLLGETPQTAVYYINPKRAQKMRMPPGAAQKATGDPTERPGPTDREPAASLLNPDFKRVSLGIPRLMLTKHWTFLRLSLGTPRLSRNQPVLCQDTSKPRDPKARPWQPRLCYPSV